MKLGKQGVKPTRAEVREHARYREKGKPKELLPISKQPVWNPLKDRGWQAVFERITPTPDSSPPC